MTHFISGLKTQTRMFLDALAGGTLSTKNKDGVKTLTKNMCQNEYRSSDRAVKQNGVLKIDSNKALLTQIEVFSKQLVASQLAQANLSKIQTLMCDFCDDRCVK